MWERASSPVQAMRSIAFAVSNQLLHRHKGRTSATARHLPNLVFVGIAHHPANTGDIRQLLWRTLGVAPRHHNLAIGVLAVNPPYRIANVLVSRRCNRAG